MKIRETDNRNTLAAQHKTEMGLKFLGTGDAGQVPMYGCDCSACARARHDHKFSRGHCCVEIEGPGGMFLIDAGIPDIAARYPAGALHDIFLTHYHMDHVAGLFSLRWGRNTRIMVHGPDDKKGCDDLHKHSGILDFTTPLLPFIERKILGLKMTPIPLNHSRACFGYLISSGHRRVAYLTDTVGLPMESTQFLKNVPIDVLILDCTHAPQNTTPRNHNDWTIAQNIIKQLQPDKTLLTHISHEMDNWLLNNALPDSVDVARDGMRIDI